MADITPPVPKGRQLITGYGGGGFKINRQIVAGSVLVFAEKTLSWSGDLTVEDLSPLFMQWPAVELLLIGSGEVRVELPGVVRERLKSASIAVEIMDTGAACRTYNILLAEERRVAAALIAI